MSWHSYRLGEVLTLKRGHDLPAHSRQHGDVPVVSSSGITGRHNEAKAKAPGVVTGRYGTIGEVFYLEEDYWPLNTSLYVIDFKRNDPRFSAYFLRNILKGYQSEKAAVPGVDRNVLHEIKVRVPDYAVQRNISDILSAYDDLIENNRRRMTLLEESARLLYNEWFVRLRFPGYEHTRIVDGVPEGWLRQTLATLCDSIDYGYTASAEKEEVGPKFLRITDIVPQVIDWTSVPYCPIEENRLAKFRLIEGDILIARTGATVGYAKRLHKLHSETVFASYLVRLRIRPEIDSLMVGIFVESDEYKCYVQSQVGGAAQPNANAKVLTAAEILVPTPSIQNIFHNSVESLMNQREVLQQQNQKLRAARDLLLPRLMSGELTV
ncbi:MAG: restriction endonuclease subunit S [Methylococcales bacterium]|nr:restriction endonuclease subunit S [Methylococcales bacterium]